jgi:uncharacterized membrane protein YhaH (DUF805 family)
MRTREAILTGLRKSFQFSGRATRSEFWWFAPVAAIPPVMLINYLQWFPPDFWGIWKLGLLFLVALPLLAAASRRLQDSGEDGHQAIYPFMPLLIMWITYLLVVWLGQIPLLVGVVTVILIVIGFILLIPIHFFVLWLSVQLTATVIGQLLISSQPGPNRYGPNPNEVTQ